MSGINVGEKALQLVFNSPNELTAKQQLLYIYYFA